MIPIILASFGLGGIIGWLVVRVSSGKRRKKIPSLTKYVVFSIAVLLIYTVSEFIFGLYHDTLHDTLTTCVYACFGGEILSCALIKIFKLKEEKDDNNAG